MFDEKYYVPILKWKMGEQKALELLPPKYKERFTPLFEIVPMPYDFEQERYSKNIDEHLQGIGQKLSNSWGNKRPVFLDLYWLDDSERMQDGKHPLEYIFEEARKYNIKVIPVTGVGRDAQYNKEVKKANHIDKLGVCVRLEDEDFFDVENNLSELLVELNITPEETDLLIDFKYISPNEENRNLISIVSILKSLPHIPRWRNVVFCGTSFPENMSGLPNDSLSTIPRSEWIIWTSLYEKKSKLNRMPIYGDYVIAHPEYIELDPRIMDRTVNIRYTIKDNWLISKGRSIKRHGSGQSHSLAKKIVKHKEFCGENFSWGDKYIYDCANNHCGPGSGETWRRVGTNHHITFVVEQLSNLSLP